MYDGVIPHAPPASTPPRSVRSPDDPTLGPAVTPGERRGGPPAPGPGTVVHEDAPAGVPDTPAGPPARTFRVRLASVLAGELLSKACFVAAFIWLARTLDPAVYGQVEWALSLTLMATLAADAGLATWAAARVAAAPGEAAVLVGEVGWLRLALAAPVYMVLLAIASARGGEAATAVAVYGLVLFLTPFNLAYLFNGMLQSHWAGIGQALRGVTFGAAVLLLVDAAASPATVALAEVLGASALVFGNVLVLQRVLRQPIRLRASPRRLVTLLGHSWPVGASEVTWGVHWYGGVVLLGYLATSADAAWHSAALRLVVALHTIVWLYFYVLLPSFARLLDRDRVRWTRTFEDSLRLTGWAGCLVALTGTLAAETLLTAVFGTPFAASKPGFQAMVWMIPIAWASGHVRYSLIAARHPRREYLAAIAGATTAVAVTMVTAGSLRSTGAGLALAAGGIVNAVAAILLARPVLPAAAIGRSLAPCSLSCLVCLVLGVVLLPLAGEIVAACSAGSALAALAVYVERQHARTVLQELRAGVAPGLAAWR